MIRPAQCVLMGCDFSPLESLRADTSSTLTVSGNVFNSLANVHFVNKIYDIKFVFCVFLVIWPPIRVLHDAFTFICKVCGNSIRNRGRPVFGDIWRVGVGGGGSDKREL